MRSPVLSSIARGVPDVDLLRALAATNRKALERMITISIDILDALDPDPDLEEDDPHGQVDEDGINSGPPLNLLNRRNLSGAGCIISDDDFDEVYEPLRASSNGRAFANVRRANLGLPPMAARR